MMMLSISEQVDLPCHQLGGFDHVDVHLESGRVYVAHAGLGTAEIMDGERARHLATLAACEDASGVVCAAHWRRI